MFYKVIGGCPEEFFLAYVVISYQTLGPAPWFRLREPLQPFYNLPDAAVGWKIPLYEKRVLLLLVVKKGFHNKPPMPLSGTGCEL